MTTTYVGKRLQGFAEPGSMGVVTDTTYIMCYWPPLARPTALFDKGSSGISVMGPPTPRNVVFPKGTVFLDSLPDARYPAELAVTAAAGRFTPMVDLPPDLVQVWLDAYASASERILKENPNAAVHATNSDCHFNLDVVATEVTEKQQVTRPVEIKPGVTVDATFLDEVTVSKPVVAITPLVAVDADGDSLSKADPADPVVLVDPVVEKRG